MVISNDFYKITGYDSYFNGYISDLRLYSHSNIEQYDLTYLSIYLQYDFSNTLHKSSVSTYPFDNSLNQYGTIDYTFSPIAVYLDGNSYLSNTINFDIKTLSFWFKSKDVNQDTYLLSTDDNFNIQVYESNLVINNNDSFININHSFDNNIWYHLALVYNDQNNYDIYIDNTNTESNINNLITAPITLNIGKKSGIFDNDNDINVELLEIYENPITAREEHSMVAIGTDIYIFGGSDSTGLVNDFYKIDKTNNTAKSITLTSSGTTISERQAHSMVAIGTDIYIFGGRDGSGLLNDFYKIDTTNSYNVTPITLSSSSGTAISGRFSHTMVAIDKDIYIFGGRDGSGYSNDFYKINTNNNIATPITLSSSGTTITGRYKHTMVAIGKDIYIFGGRDGSNYFLSDFYKINTTNDTAILITLTDATITGRREHTMVAIGTDIYIFGGSDNTGRVNDFYKIDTTNDTATQIPLSSSGTTITGRIEHTMVAIDKDIYIFGGNSSGVSNDFYKITGYDSYFNGYISDLRLYSHSNIEYYEL